MATDMLTTFGDSPAGFTHHDLARAVRYSPAVGLGA